MIVYLNSFGLFCLHIKLSLCVSKELEMISMVITQSYSLWSSEILAASFIFFKDVLIRILCFGFGL